MLLEMPKAFGRWLGGFGEVTCVTEGASKAVFRLEPRPDCAGVVDAARKWLRTEYPHATIAVASVGADGGGYFASDEKLTAAIRGMQMRSFSFAGLPEPEGDGICAWDHVRPATTLIHAKGEVLRVSKSTAAKHGSGQDAKRSFLHHHAGLGGDWKYTSHMDELSGCPVRGALHHKLSVFYADGNSFTKLLRIQLQGIKPQRQEQVIRKFDQYLQGRRKAFLTALLNRTAEPRWQTADGARRIEVLLWGGDELMLVVPAWCGWETAELFCQTMKGAVFPEGRVEVPLKHAMGLVFAHHKAPIHALRRLVRDLAEEAKNQDRKADLLSYLVLESFDHIGEDLQRFRQLRGGGPASLRAENNALGQMSKLLKSFRDSEFPRRKVFQATLGLSHGKNWEMLKEDVEPFLKPWEKGLAEWKRLTGGGAVPWLHLADLWDYVGVDL